MWNHTEQDYNQDTRTKVLLVPKYTWPNISICTFKNTDVFMCVFYVCQIAAECKYAGAHDTQVVWCTLRSSLVSAPTPMHPSGPAPSSTSTTGSTLGGFHRHISSTTVVISYLWRSAAAPDLGFKMVQIIFLLGPMATDIRHRHPIYTAGAVHGLWTWNYLCTWHCTAAFKR